MTSQAVASSPVDIIGLDDLVTIHELGVNQSNRTARKRGSVQREESTDDSLGDSRLKRLKYSIITFPPAMDLNSIVKTSYALAPDHSLQSLTSKISDLLLQKEKLYFHYRPVQHSFLIFFMKGSYFARMKISIFTLRSVKNVLPSLPMTKALFGFSAHFEEGDKDLFYELFHYLKDSFTVGDNDNNLMDGISGNLSQLCFFDRDKVGNEKRITSNFEFYSQNQPIVSGWISSLTTCSNYGDSLICLLALYNLCLCPGDKRMIALLEELGLLQSLIECLKKEFISRKNDTSNLASGERVISSSICYSQSRRKFQYFLLLTLSCFADSETALEKLAGEPQLIQFLTQMTSRCRRCGSDATYCTEERCFQCLELIPVRDSCFHLLSRFLARYPADSSSFSVSEWASVAGIPASLALERQESFSSPIVAEG